MSEEYIGVDCPNVRIFTDSFRNITTYIILIIMSDVETLFQKMNMSYLKKQLNHGVYNLEMYRSKPQNNNIYQILKVHAFHINVRGDDYGIVFLLHPTYTEMCFSFTRLVLCEKMQK